MANTKKNTKKNKKKPIKIKKMKKKINKTKVHKNKKIKKCSSIKASSPSVTQTPLSEIMQFEEPPYFIEGQKIAAVETFSIHKEGPFTNNEYIEFDIKEKACKYHIELIL